MSNFNFSFGKDLNSSGKNKSLFGNDINFINNNRNIFNQATNPIRCNPNQIIFGDNANNPTATIFNNSNNYFDSSNIMTDSVQDSVFNEKNSKYIYDQSLLNQQQLDNTIGFKFKRKKFKDKKLMTITFIPEYNYASQEELRLADYEKMGKGKVNGYKILNTKNKINNNDVFNNNYERKNFLEDSKNKQGFFQNIPTQDNYNNLFKSSINQRERIFGDNDIFQGKSLFSNNNLNNKIGIIVENNKTNPNGVLFNFNKENNNQIENKSLFNNNTFSSFFNENKNDKKEGNFFFDNNNNKSLFNNLDNKTSDKNNFSLFDNFNNQNNNFIGANKVENYGKSLFDNTLFTNVLNTNPLTSSNNKPLDFFQQNTGSNKNNIFPFNNTNNNKTNFNIGEPLNITKNNNYDNNNNNSIFKPQANNFQNSFYENFKANNNQDQGSFQNVSRIQATNNNINYINNNNDINHNISKVNVTLNDIMDPLNYLSTQNTMKLSPNDEVLSNSIPEIIQKQTNVNQFLDDFEEKYNKKENIDNSDNNENDILDNYGTYLDNSENFNFSKYEEKPSSLYTNESFKSPNQKPKKINIEENNRIYNKEEMSNSLSKVNNIYQEYEKYKDKFKDNSDDKVTDKLNFDTNINDNKNISKPKQYEYQSSIFGRNEALYHKNMMAIDKLSNNEIKINNNNLKDKKDNKEIVIKNNDIKDENENNFEKINLPKIVDLTIKYNLIGQESSEFSDTNQNILIIKNVDPSIKIQLLTNEIKLKIIEELKLKELEKFYSIEKISLSISEIPLLEEKSLLDYDLKSCNFTIKACISYKENKIKEQKDEFVPLELVPKLTKEGYKCIPSILELSRKTKDELSKIEGFKVYNKFGEVEFMEPVNLLGLNLDEQITIEPNIIDTGDKLDYNSKFKLYNIKVEEEGLNRYKINLEQSGGNLLEYKNNEIVWEYKKK